MTRKEEIIESLFNEYRGWLPRVFSWDNYEDIPYWYDASTKTIQTSCGVSIPFDYPENELTVDLLHSVLSQLEDRIIEYFREVNNKELFTPDD